MTDLGLKVDERVLFINLYVYVFNILETLKPES